MATKKEEEHMNNVASLCCIACQIIDIPDSPAEIHHVREASSHKDNMKVLPLCPIHHRHGMFDIAIHQSKKRFEAKFGTQEELLKRVEELLDK